MKHCVQAFLAPAPIARSSFQNKAVSQTVPTSYVRRTTHVPPHPTVIRLTPTALDSLVLTEQNVNQALDEVKVKLGSIFGNSHENREVGITGDVVLATLDGPVVVLRLQGRFWHKRSDVLARVSAYLMERIPEICDVQIEEEQQLQDSEAEGIRLA